MHIRRSPGTKSNNEDGYFFLLASLYFIVFLQATFQALIKIKARQHVTESPRKLIKIWSQKYISSKSFTPFSLGSNHNLLIVRKIEKS